MQVRDLMTKRIDVVSPHTSVKDAARMMKDSHSSLLAVGTDAGLIGMLTAQDIAVRAAAEGRDPKITLVEDVMSLGFLVCFEDQDLQEALDTMRRKRANQLPVLNRRRRLVGRFAAEDLVFQPRVRRAVERGLNQLNAGRHSDPSPN